MHSRNCRQCGPLNPRRPTIFPPTGVGRMMVHRKRKGDGEEGERVRGWPALHKRAASLAALARGQLCLGAVAGALFSSLRHSSAHVPYLTAPEPDMPL